MKKLAINLDSLKIDFSKVQQDQPGLWPTPLKVLVWVGVVILVVLVGNNFYLSDIKQNLQSKQAEEIALKKDFEDKAFKAKNLGELREQMETATKSLNVLLKQLPSQTEVPGLLEDITKTGLGSGLEFATIKLGAEKKAQFYAELPITISVRGGYHEFATFVSGVSALSRIVSLHDFKLEPLPGGTMKMDIQAKTYRADNVNADKKAAPPQDAKAKSKK